MTWSNVRCQVSGVAAAALPALLVLYPLLLLLDDLEPGFVRSAVNPHWFLLALIVIGIVTGRELASPSLALRQAQGIWRATLVLLAAIIAGFWVWWRVGGGRIGVVIGVLTAVAVGGAVVAVVGNPKSEYRNPKQ